MSNTAGEYPSSVHMTARLVCAAGVLRLLAIYNGDTILSDGPLYTDAIVQETPGQLSHDVSDATKQSCLNTPEYSQGGTEYIENLDDMERFHNQIRSEQGLPPLTRDARLDHSAQDTADYLANLGQMQHVHEPGKAGLVRAGELVKNWQKIGENLGAGSDQDDCYGNAIAAAWVRSPGHFSNIVDPSYGLIGLGVAENDAGIQIIVAHFAKALPMAKSESTTE